VPSANAGATSTYASSSAPSLLTASAKGAGAVISAPKDAPANAVVSLPSPEEIAEAVRGAKSQEAPLKEAEEKKEEAVAAAEPAEPAAAPKPKRQPNPITGPRRSNGNKNGNNSGARAAANSYPTMVEKNARNVPLTPVEQRRAQAFSANAEVAAVSLEEARRRMADALEALQGAIFERAQEGAEAIFGPEGPFSGPFWRGAERDMEDDVEAELEEREDDDDDAPPPPREQEEAQQDDDLLRSALYGRNNNNNNNRGNADDDDDLASPFNAPPVQRSVVRVQVGPYQTSPFASSSSAFPRGPAGFGGGGLFGPFGPGPVMYPPPQQHMMQQMQQQQQYQAPPVSRPGVTRAQMAELDSGVKDAGKALDDAMRAFNEAMGKRVQAGLVTFFEGYAPEKVEEEEETEVKKDEGVAVAAIPAVEEEKKVEAEAAPAPVVAAEEETKVEESKKEEAPAKEEKKAEEKMIEEESPAKAAPIEEEKKVEEKKAEAEEAAVAPADAPVAPVVAVAPATTAEAPKEKEAEVKA
jgi:hypothetical protein